MCPRPTTEGVLPKRLIDVGVDGATCCLRYSSELANPTYAALSYVWGGSQPVVLRRASTRSMHKSIKIALLPKTIRDAITATRRLGLAFLWIDAFCIVQDDDDDKNREIARMDEIYFNAHITICAASATKCQAGFLENKSSEFPGVAPRPIPVLDFACPNRKLGQIMVTPARTYDPIIEPLNTRGWCFQERLLSPRLLTYGSWQMYWQCQSKHFCDGGDVSRFEPVGIERLSAIAFSNTNSNAGPALSGDDREALYQNWLSIAQEYNLREIGDPNDKLPALAGIAKRFGQALYDDEYCAGLWKSQLLPSLAWKAGDPQPGRPLSYRAPTWSWASVDGAVQLLPEALLISIDESERAEVVSCFATPLSTQVPYGQVKAGQLVLKGRCIEMQWDGSILESDRGPKWAIHPDIFLTSWPTDSSDDGLPDKALGQDNQIKYDIHTHQSLKEARQNSSDMPEDEVAATITIVCIRITDIAALVLEQVAGDSAKDISTTVPARKRRKTASNKFTTGSKASGSADAEKMQHKRVGIMIFEGPDGGDDADLFFKSAVSRVVTII